MHARIASAIASALYAHSRAKVKAGTPTTTVAAGQDVTVTDNTVSAALDEQGHTQLELVLLVAAVIGVFLLLIGVTFH